MPNTLAHIGLQVPLCKSIAKTIPLHWIALGCVIPDIPWVIRRIAAAFAFLDGIDLMLYAGIQASLAFSFLLAISLALCSKRMYWVAGILCANVLVHLLLDAAQIKWGNGVHLFAPFSWETLQLNLFWPEHGTSYLATAAGCILLVIYWPREVSRKIDFSPKPYRLLVAFTGIVLYLSAPLFLLEQPRKANYHFSQTLQDKEQRTGKYIELDRESYSAQEKTITVFSGETLSLTGNIPEKSGTLSVQGAFVAPDVINVTRFHEHGFYRASLSLIGILLIALFWLHSIVYQFKARS